MKKKVLLLAGLLAGPVHTLFAATGNASDGLMGLLVIIGALLLLAGLLYTADYLHRNGKRLFNAAVVLSKRIIRAIVSFAGKVRSGHFDLSWSS